MHLYTSITRVSTSWRGGLCSLFLRTTKTFCTRTGGCAAQLGTGVDGTDLQQLKRISRFLLCCLSSVPPFLFISCRRNLASVFSSDPSLKSGGSGGASSLTYSAPKQPKKQQQQQHSSRGGCGRVGEDGDEAGLLPGGHVTLPGLPPQNQP